MKSDSTNEVVIRINSLYSYDFYDDKVTEYKIIKQTAITLWLNPYPKYGITIKKSEIGRNYFITKEQAIGFTLLKIAADKWMSLISDIDWSERIKKRCQREGLNWRAIWF